MKNFERFLSYWLIILTCLLALMYAKIEWAKEEILEKLAK